MLGPQSWTYDDLHLCHLFSKSDNIIFWYWKFKNDVNGEKIMNLPVLDVPLHSYLLYEFGKSERVVCTNQLFKYKNFEEWRKNQQK